MNGQTTIQADPNGVLSSPAGTLFYRHNSQYYSVDPVTNQEVNLHNVTDALFFNKASTKGFYKKVGLTFSTEWETWVKTDSPKGAKFGWTFAGSNPVTFVELPASTPGVTPSVTPTISLTPSAVTPTPSVTPAVTGTPALTPTPPVTSTPEVTPTPEATVTPEVTTTPESTVTPEPTGTPVETPTPEVTSTPESTPDPTPDPTGTPVETPTPEATVTPEPTGTPEVTPTPIPPGPYFLDTTNFDTLGYVTGGFDSNGVGYSDSGAERPMSADITQSIGSIHIWDVSGSIDDSGSLIAVSRNWIGSIVPNGSIQDITSQMVGAVGGPDHVVVFTALGDWSSTQYDLMVVANIVDSTGSMTNLRVREIPHTNPDTQMIEVIDSGSSFVGDVGYSFGIGIDDVTGSSGTFSLVNGYAHPISYIEFSALPPPPPTPTPSPIIPSGQYFLDTAGFGTLGYVTGGIDNYGEGFATYSSSLSYDMTASINAIYVWEISGSWDATDMFVTSSTRILLGTVYPDGGVTDITTFVRSALNDPAYIMFDAAGDYSSRTYDLMTNAQVVSSTGSVTLELFRFIPSNGLRTLNIIGTKNGSMNYAAGARIDGVSTVSASFSLTNAYGHPIYYVDPSTAP